MIATFYQDATSVFNTTTINLTRISENIAASRITENVSKISEAINKRLHLAELNCGGLNPETHKVIRRTPSPYGSLTRLEVNKN